MLYLAAIVAIFATGCSQADHFKVGGLMEGAGVQTVTLTYYAEGGIKQTVGQSVNGKFLLQGKSAVPTLCIVALSDGTPVATLIASNGDKIEVRTSLENPAALKVKGSGQSSKIADWLNENAELLARGDAAAINASIAEFIDDHRSDMASTALLVTQFRTDGFETMADSLLSLIDISARPAPVVQNFSAVLSSQLNRSAGSAVMPMTLYIRSDSTYFLTPAQHSVTLLAFTEPVGGRDTVTTVLRELRGRYSDRRCGIVEISAAVDSSTWKQATARDSATWKQAWAPGTVASSTIGKLSVPRIPYFIVADSTGTQLYRGGSVSAAHRLIGTRLH